MPRVYTTDDLADLRMKLADRNRRLEAWRSYGGTLARLLDAVFIVDESGDADRAGAARRRLAEDAARLADVGEEVP